MQEPIDPLNTPSGRGDEARADKPVGTPHGATDEVASNAEGQNSAKDNTDSTSTPPVENLPSNEKTANEWLTSNLPNGFTPLRDLVRRGADRQINVALYTLLEDKTDLRIRYDLPSHYVPQMPFALYQSLILPSDLGTFLSDRKLFDCIVALLQKHVMLSEKECSLLAYWSIATWFPDFLPFIPSVVITGPAAATDLLLRTLVAVCRRPVLLADASPAVLSALPLGALSPTLLMREPQLNKRMAALLDASSQPGYWVLRNKDVQHFYCAKCIYIGEAARDQLSMPNSIHIRVGGNSLRSFYPLPADDVIKDFQNRLLFYRIMRRDVVAASKFRVSGFRPEVCAIAQVLGAAMGCDPELQRGIIELLKERDEQLRVDHASGQNGMVLRAVLWHCHQHNQQQVFVRELAATANQLYREEGESLKISNQTVGHVLKNLGLYTRRLGNAGRGLMLDKATQARTHELSYASDVLPDSAGVPDCGHCHKMQLLETQEVV